MEPLTSELQSMNEELDLMPPASVGTPLWRSLWENLRDRFAPERLPPLHLTARPVDVGMLLGDRVALPWYRTVFGSIGDVLNPETLPPLELESQPVDVGELIGDEMQHGWWTSLLRNLADNVSPERMPPLQMTSAPVNPEMASYQLMAPRWSNLLPTPKVFLPDRPRPVSVRFEPRPLEPASVPIESDEIPGESDILRDIVSQTRRALRHARLREITWVSLAAAEVVFLIVYSLGG